MVCDGTLSLSLSFQTTMPNCTHTFYAHSWTEAHMSRQTRLDTIGDHACYDPAKDVVVPSWTWWSDPAEPAHARGDWCTVASLVAPYARASSRLDRLWLWLKRLGGRRVSSNDAFRGRGGSRSTGGVGGIHGSTTVNCSAF